MHPALTRRATLATVLAVLLGIPESAAAHGIFVAPGTAGVELDLGTGQPARLIHAVLTDADDEVALQVAPGGATVVELFVPAAAPEADAKHSDLPKLTIGAAPGDARFVEPGGGELDELRDETTGIRYRRVARTELAAAEDARVLVRRGDVPTRVAIRVAEPDADFATEEPDRTPRALVTLRAWAESPAPGVDARPRSGPGSTQADRDRRAWIGGGIALGAVVIAVWWLGAGWRRSRERGRGFQK